MDVADLLESPEITTVATGLKFTEGPLWHPDGYLLFTDVGGPWRIWKVVPGEEKTVYRDGNGPRDGPDVRSARQRHSVRADGARGDEHGLRGECNGHRNPLRREAAEPSERRSRAFGTGTCISVTVALAAWKRARRTSSTTACTVSRPTARCMRRSTPFEDPNGLAISPNEKTYYQINTRPSAHIDAFDIAGDGSLSNQRRFFTFPESDKPGFPDGMKVDSVGRVYVSGPGGLWVLTPGAEVIGVVEFPEQVINMAWGDADNKTMYIAAMTSIYSIRFNTPGLVIPRAAS